MNKPLVTCITLLSMVFIAGSVVGQELFIYPNKGQSAEQQDKDKFECYSWAKNSSGFDPMAPPTATAPPPQQQAKKGGVIRGAAGGAAVGAIVGDSDDAKKGAAVGGLLGGMRRNEQKRQQQHDQQQWEQEQTQQYAQARNNYNRGYAACLEGRGYTVR